MGVHVDGVRRAIARHQRVDEAVDAIGQTLTRGENTLHRHETTLIRMLRDPDYSGRTLVSGGRAYTLIDDELYVRDVLDLDIISDPDWSGGSGRSHHTCNPEWNPGDLIGMLDAINDGEMP